ncbi:MAG: hypothetical protein IID45_03645 [Planctomycetes bacterium]|nr:hypothetical protein [Planctomycetota bacterium]
MIAGKDNFASEDRLRRVRSTISPSAACSTSRKQAGFYLTGTFGKATVIAGIVKGNAIT